MQAFFKTPRFLKTFQILVLGFILTVPTLAWSNTVEETPGPLTMTADALFVRPVMAVTTIIGAGIFIVSSPFAALGGNIDESWDTLVKQPFRVTLDRCLGCVKVGRKSAKVVNQTQK